MGLILDISKYTPPSTAGNKAENIWKLSRLKVRVPKTFAVKWDAFHRYIENDGYVIKELEFELSKIIDPGISYAVRSSANIEDGMDRSFAGQFDSVLHVRGTKDIIEGIKVVWSSARSPAVKIYLERHNFQTQNLSMGVIIQEMVKPVYSGVALSKNPVTGADEIVVEAVDGEGTQLVQIGATPYRWVNKWGYWVEKAEGSNMPINLIQKVITTTRTIAKKLRQSVDLEWVYDGSELYWVQVREITTLNNFNVYSNHISREFLPGMIKPLIFSINVPLVNSVWIEWIEEITGDIGLKPEDLAKSFYYRAYFNMGTLGTIFEELGFPRESVEIIMGSLPRGAARPSFKPSAKTLMRLPWLLYFIYDKWTFAPKMRRALNILEQRIKSTPYLNLEQLTESDLLTAIEHHYKLMQRTAYFNVLGPLMMGMYNNVLKSQLKSRDVEFANFDLTKGMDIILEYDPATHLRRLNVEFQALPIELRKKIRRVSYREFLNIKEAGDFSKHVSDMINKFGHLSDNGNDFSVIPWRENPDLVLKLVTEFDAPSEESNKITMSDLKSKGKANLFFTLFYKRAREFRLLREQVSSLYTYGYGLFRYFFLALGEHFAHRNLVESRDDIFFLTYDQVKSLGNGTAPEKDIRAEIEKHKYEMERFRDILTPTIIYGDEIPPIRDPNMDLLGGIPTSIGYYTGRVKVVKGIQDFGKVEQGDVLVVPYSDVGWTPLFARAGAVVAESGGLLSHSSIVAREYNIPAVVSVENATLIPDGTIVTVDGHKGEILVHK
ncbi:MAG TPA: hypothetical protein DCX53_11630 [Anaerolineae bacterium]|nr:hypothetical protein [Anaerolineae bacterium]